MSDLNPLSYDQICFNIKVIVNQNNNLDTLGKQLSKKNVFPFIHGIL